MIEADMKRKNPKNLRLSDDGEGLLLALSRKLGLKQTGIVELAIRKLADSEGVTLAVSASTGAASPQNVTSSLDLPSSGE